MAKVSLNKITPVKSGEIKEVEINGEKIQIHQYLPTQDKIALTERVLGQAFDETNHYSKYRLTVYTILEIIRAYTNINFTETQLKDIPKLYDLLVLNNIIEQIRENIPTQEWNELTAKVVDEANHLESYLNSFAGVMKTISTDYSNTEMDVDKISAKLNDPEALKTVKEILDKIG